jgi:hypothetical protein
MGMKRPEPEAYHSPPPSTQVKITWSYISNPPYTFMAWLVTIHREELPFISTVSSRGRISEWWGGGEETRVMSYFKLLSHNFPGGVKENCRKTTNIPAGTVGLWERIRTWDVLNTNEWVTIRPRRSINMFQPAASALLSEMVQMFTR